MAEMKGNRGLARAIAQAYTRKWSFLAAFIIVFLFSLSLLASMDLVPEVTTSKNQNDTKVATTTALDALPKEYPVRIEIPAIDLKVSVANPTSTNVATLDAALLKGAVRYPTSAKLGEKGNTILFGHSSYLPVVNNQAYKAFNAIQNLKKGDRITVYGNGQAYVYAVDNVYQADATADAIPLTATGHTLTLVTCDSFATKSDRFVAVATLVESYSVAN